MQCPISSLGRVLASAAVRLTPSEVGHLAARRERRNQAIVNTSEQGRGVLTPVIRISHKPRNDVPAAPGIQSIAIGALTLLAHFPLARSTRTAATAAVLT